MRSHSHSQLTSKHLSNNNLSNVTNAKRRHLSGSFYTCRGGRLPCAHVEERGGTVHVDVWGNDLYIVYHRDALTYPCNSF